jgi:hypothetical protein
MLLPLACAVARVGAADVDEDNGADCADDVEPPQPVRARLATASATIERFIRISMSRIDLVANARPARLLSSADC